MNFDNIICANTQIKGLEKAIYENSVIQSLIIEGQEGTGKKTLTSIYSNALICQSDKDKPCGKCKGCKLFLSDNHPDVFLIARGNKKTIGVEQIKYLQKQAVIKPNEGNRKVFIIYDAHTMTVQAQNALLKLIEEPPGFLSIILVCTNTMPLLETIISRCSVIPMPYLAYKDIVKGLVFKGIETEKAKIIALGANGSLGRALNRYNDSSYLETREKLINILFILIKNKTRGYSEASMLQTLSKEMIIIWQSVVRDAIIYKSGTIDNIENIDKMNEIGLFADMYSKEELIKKLEALCDAEKRLYFNAQYKLVLDNLMINM